MICRLALLFSLVSITACAGPTGRAKYETPNYKAVASDGAFEIRDYPSMVLATTPMAATKRSGQNSAFMNLFRYISGKNANSQKIEMTTPVFSTMKEQDNAMSFVVPAEVVAGGVPQANNPEVVINKRAAGRYAAYQYSGRWSQAREREAREKLASWVQKRGLKLIGEYEKASYDPPFTPPSKRRNEVLIRITK